MERQLVVNNLQNTWRNDIKWHAPVDIKLQNNPSHSSNRQIQTDSY